MARQPLIVGNWKMHCTRAEARALIAGLTPLVLDTPGREIIVAPPFTALETVARTTMGTPIGLAAQNLHWEPKGAFTGEIAAGMLREIGCTAVIVGHSERRQFFGETDDTVNRKIRAAIAAGLLPIVCVGETLEQRQGNETTRLIERQLRAGFADFTPADVATCVVAYEPIWAIGTGHTATPAQAQEVHALIRRVAAAVATADVADRLRILYGGSVKADNIDGLMAEADVDGALVGGASLQAESFARIVKFE
jgi:triosephosphate isomerase